MTEKTPIYIFLVGFFNLIFNFHLCLGNLCAQNIFKCVHPFCFFLQGEWFSVSPSFFDTHLYSEFAGSVFIVTICLWFLEFSSVGHFLYLLPFQVKKRK